MYCKYIYILETYYILLTLLCKIIQNMVRFFHAHLSLLHLKLLPKRIKSTGKVNIHNALLHYTLRVHCCWFSIFFFLFFIIILIARINKISTLHTPNQFIQISHDLRHFNCRKEFGYHFEFIRTWFIRSSSSLAANETFQSTTKQLVRITRSCSRSSYKQHIFRMIHTSHIFHFICI